MGKWEAREAAAKTIADLWDWLQHNTFPFDVTFDRWAERALRYRLTTTVRFRRRQDRHVVDSLDRPCFEEGDPFGDLLPTDDMRVWLELESRREVVRQAWTKLDQRQAHIIHRWYVEGWSADEIAAETRLAVNHIYVLKHRGLKKLREYCAERIAPRRRFSSPARRRTRIRRELDLPLRGRFQVGLDDH